MKKDLKQEVLDKIKKDKIRPISKKIFSWKNRLLWLIVLIILILLWITFSFLYNDLIESINEWANDFSNRLFLIPNIFWFTIIISLLFILLFNYRKTKYWYKQSTYIIILSTLIITIFMWSFFIFTNFSRYFQNDLVENSTFLRNYVYQENLWNNPENWKLIWVINEVKENTIILKDINWKVWTISTKNSIIWNNVKLLKNEKVRIIWLKTNESSFDANKIIPYFWKWNWWWKWKNHY